ARGGDVADTLKVRPRRRAPDHGSGGVIANARWTFAPPNGYAADGMPWAVNLKSKRPPNRENEDWPGVLRTRRRSTGEDHDRTSAACPKRPPAGRVGLCRNGSWRGAGR